MDITFSVEKNRFGKSHQRLKDEALRACDKSSSQGNHITPNVLFRIYDSLIQPIRDYGTEVWYQGKNH